MSLTWETSELVLSIDCRATVSPYVHGPSPPKIWKRPVSSNWSDELHLLLDSNCWRMLCTRLIRSTWRTDVEENANINLHRRMRCNVKLPFRWKRLRPFEPDPMNLVVVLAHLRNVCGHSELSAPLEIFPPPFGHLQFQHSRVIWVALSISRWKLNITSTEATGKFSKLHRSS